MADGRREPIYPAAMKIERQVRSNRWLSLISAALSTLAFLGNCAAAELRVPAFTAYLDPNSEGAEVEAPGGITGW